MNHWLRVSKLGLLAVGLLWITEASSYAKTKDGEWKEWEDCRYIPNEAANDGDSFWVQYNKRSYKVRLYFVDTPETTDKEDWAVSRLKAQAEYFGIDDPDFALRIGEDAKDYVKKLLSKHPFTIYTRLQEAMGRGKTRYYAMIKVEDQYLSKLLVDHGFVRINKRTLIKNPLPEGQSVDRFEKQLRELERQARKEGVGGWAKLKPKGRNSVESILAERAEGAAAQPEVQLAGRIIRLRRTIAIYSTKNPQKMVSRVRAGSRVKVMGVTSDGMLRIRFNPEKGIIYEGLCHRISVGL